MGFDPVSYLMGKEAGGGGVTVEALTVTQNETITAPDGKAYSPVTVAVPTWKLRVTEGTLASPFGDMGFSGVYNALNAAGHIGAMGYFLADASAIAAGTYSGGVTLDSNSNRIVFFASNVTSTHSSAVSARYDANGLIECYVEQDGQITDMTAYAAYITTTVGFSILS